MNKKYIWGLVVLLGVAGFSTLVALPSKTDSNALAEQTEQTAEQLATNTMEYIMVKGRLPTETFNPFLQEGMFPNLIATCNKQDDACVDKNFVYTGKCNATTCTLNIAHLKATVSFPFSLEQVSYMISMQVQPNGNIKLWKRGCFYNDKLGKQVCSYLQERGWLSKSMGKNS